MNDYSDIINLPHHTSTKHTRMSLRDRSAQFAPFAALTGFDPGGDKTPQATDFHSELALDKKSGKRKHTFIPTDKNAFQTV